MLRGQILKLCCLLSLCFTPVKAVIGLFTLDCDSSITEDSAGYCIGVPISCRVNVDQESCTSIFVKEYIQVRITELENSTFNPPFTLSQRESVLTVTADYVPRINRNITVEVSGNSTINCSFVVTYTALASTSCHYPLSFNVMNPNLSFFMGGDSLNLILEVTASSPLVMVTFVLDDVHPTLLLIDHIFSSVNQSRIYTDLVNVHSVGNRSTLLVGGIRLATNEKLVANIVFRVQLFVLPRAHLFFSLKAYYYSTFGEVSSVQSLNFFEEFQTFAINPGRLSLHLPFYAPEDHVENTYPPHVGDTFSIELQIGIPCISTRLSFTVSLPEFWSVFFTNISDINVHVPSDLVYISELCNYEEGSQPFDPSSCDVDSMRTNLRSPRITMDEGAAPGVDRLSFIFGPVIYDMKDCAECECTNQNIIVSFTGEVLTDMVCLDQTLADNITVDYEFVNEFTTKENILDLDPKTTIMFNDSLDEEISAINASMPAISLPIRSLRGDAGDSYILTFGVLHNREYSSFTAYDLNYTFSVNTYLEPDENITICFYNTSRIPFICEEHPFINYTISRDGFHPIFTLNADRIELTIGVTIIQNVAPRIRFCNNGDTIFQTLPDNNTMDLSPLVCTNSSCGRVVINPVILQPWVIHWSDVEATRTESPADSSYVTIGEQFNMTLRACMPESRTGIELFVILPRQISGPLVMLNDAYVTYIGSELYNTTLSEGDALDTTEDITLISQTRLRFHFGTRVLIPDDNILIDAEQCFEIGLDFTVLDNPSLVHQSVITFTGFVETDFGIRSSRQRISLEIAEPLMLFTHPTRHPNSDGGDPITSSVMGRLTSSTTSTFQYQLTFEYLTQFFDFSERSAKSSQFLHNNSQIPSYTPVARLVDDATGNVVFYLDELVYNDIITAILVLTLTDNIRNSQVYGISFEVDWNSLPHGFEGGRTYNYNGSLVIPTSMISIGITYITSRPLTPDPELQVQEEIFANITVIFPEGISELSLLISHIDKAMEDQSLNITYGEVLHVGENIMNIFLSPGDTLTSSRNITSRSISDILFECGSEVRNQYDNILDSKDEVVVYIIAYVSNDGTDTMNNQVIILQAEDLRNHGLEQTERLLLVHPNLEMTVTRLTEPFSLLDGGDTVSIEIQVAHVNSTPPAHVAYDLTIEFTGDNFRLELFNGTITGTSCFAGGPVPFSTNGIGIFHIPYLICGCTGHFVFSTNIPDDLAFAGHSIEMRATLAEFYGTSSPSILERRNYGPRDSFFLSEQFKSPAQSIEVARTLRDSNFVAPLDIIDIKHVVTFPEGRTLQVSIHYTVRATFNGRSLTTNSGINSPYFTEIFPMSESSSLPRLGDVYNPSDNVNDIGDSALFNFTVAIPSNSSGARFVITAFIDFNNTIELIRIADSTLEYTVVLPSIRVDADVSKKSVLIGDTIIFTLSISRNDATQPDYSVTLHIVLFLPLDMSLLVSLDHLKVTYTPQENEMKAEIFLSPLSYTGDNSKILVNFEGFIGTMAYIIQLLGFIEYQADPTNGHVYREPITFPEISTMQQLDFSFNLRSNGLELENGLVVLNEIVIWRVEIEDIRGPMRDLSLVVELSNILLNITGVEIIFVGPGINYSGDPILHLRHDMLTLTFIDLSGDVEDCSDCGDMILDVYLLVVISDAENHLSSINASVSFGDSMKRQATGSNIVFFINSKLVQSSSGLTKGNEFAVHELFQIIIEILIPPGLTNTNLVISIMSPNQAIEILANKTYLPQNVSAKSQDISVSRPANGVLQMIWNLVELSNPYNVTVDDGELARLEYTAVLLESSTPNSPLEMTATYVLDDKPIASSILLGSTAVPILLVKESFLLTLDENGTTTIQARITLSHDSHSNGPAFFVTLKKTIPEPLLVNLPCALEFSDGLLAVENICEIRGRESLLNLRIDTFPLGETVNLTYFAKVNQSNRADANMTQPVFVNYTTIKQEGIGLMYKTIFTGQELRTRTISCLLFTSMLRYSYRNIISVIIGMEIVFIIIIIVVLVLICCCCCILRRTTVKEDRVVVAPALIAAVIVRHHEDKDCLIFDKRKRVLFSSLLLALPKKTWSTRDDTYESKESDYINEIEESLLYAKEQMLTRLFQYFLRTQISLTKNRITEINEIFDMKVNILQRTLKDSKQTVIQSVAYKFAGDTVLEEEEQDRLHQESVADMEEKLSMNLTIAKDVLEHVKEYHQLEKADVLDIIGLKRNLEKNKIIRRYNSHYLLGLKAIVINVLQDASNGNIEVLDELDDLVEYGEQVIQGEINELNEMADTRSGRQKLVLLKKKLIEEGDDQWRQLMLRHINISMAELIRVNVISEEGSEIVKEKMEKDLLEEFDKFTSKRNRKEDQIILKAKVALDVLEKQLSKQFQRKYYSSGREMLESELQRWHDRQVKREEALKEVEDNELMKCWDDWITRRDKIIKNFTGNLGKRLMAEGLDLRQSERITKMLYKSKNDLRDVLEVNETIQEAKFRGRMDYLREKLFTDNACNKDMCQKKMEKEIEYLKEMEATFKDDQNIVLEEYYSEVVKFDWTLSRKRIMIHIRLKERISIKRGRKFEFVYSQYIHKRQQMSEEECLKVLLEKRRDILLEISMRLYEKERRKVEDDVMKEKEKILVNITFEHPAVESYGVLAFFSSPLGSVQLTDETKDMLKLYQENLIKMSIKLNDEKKKAIDDLERKMKQRQIQRQKTLMELVVPTQPAMQMKNSKLKELVKKQILATRLEKIRDQQMKSLIAGAEDLQQHFQAKHQDEIDRLEKDIEVRLVKSGKVSPDKLVEILKILEIKVSPSFQDGDLLNPPNDSVKRPCSPLPSLDMKKSTSPFYPISVPIELINISSFDDLKETTTTCDDELEETKL